MSDDLEQYRYLVVEYDSGMPVFGSFDYWDCVDYIEQRVSEYNEDEEPQYWIMDTLLDF